MIKLVGFIAAACTTIAFAPQLIKAWRTRSTEDISLGMYLILTFGILMWLIYGVLLGDAPLVIANGITLALASGILLLKITQIKTPPPPD